MFHFLCALLFLGSCAHSSMHAQYKPPTAAARTVQDIHFSAAQTIAPELTQIYQDCDKSTQRGGCATDPARNTVLLKFPDTLDAQGVLTTSGPVFFDAKMAVDADGSALSKAAVRPNQPETAFRYPSAADAATPGPSLDSEHVPYIVMPMGGFRQATGVALGDVAAVVKDGQVHFAIVGDVGPRTHIGEGSMYLHSEFGHLDCRARDEEKNCSEFVDVSLDPPVLYFLFPDSRRLLIDGLAPDNINERIRNAGARLWGAFLRGQRSLAVQQTQGGGK